MKKSILSLAVLGLLSTSVMANSIDVDVDNSVPGVAERPQPQVPGNLPDVNVPERPQPELPPAHLPVTDVERPQPDDATPSRPQPDDVTPERPQPDNTPDRPEPVDPSFGIPAIGAGDNQVRIDSLEASFQEMAREMRDHAEQLDGVRAGMHAVTNARPFVAEGEFGVGVGVGFSGSKEALALGGAYGINENLSVSGTFHYETSGKYSSSDVAGGVGLQYTFK
ncbi:YadA-like family protein [Thaumasiovibrio subtropicus]|uniref:YadA-like family protein n=1 Tax=Thaumasiovibrio subtropicus TaxID=1891207 RepID=UPI000B362475|nr:YadA-like family protein [Thaumasiovibrio subtropicus]